MAQFPLQSLPTMPSSLCNATTCLSMKFYLQNVTAEIKLALSSYIFTIKSTQMQGGAKVQTCEKKPSDFHINDTILLKKLQRDYFTRQVTQSNTATNMLPLPQLLIQIRHSSCNIIDFTEFLCMCSIGSFHYTI